MECADLLPEHVVPHIHVFQAQLLPVQLCDVHGSIDTRLHHRYHGDPDGLMFRMGSSHRGGMLTPKEGQKDNLTESGAVPIC